MKIGLIKEHLTYKEAFPMANEPVPFKPSTNIEEFLRKQSTGASFGNIDASDLKPPRLKLLAGQSPEVIDGAPGASPGNFWVTILNQSLGPVVTGSPILLRKTYQVWAPKGLATAEQKGPLATASDGINWDVPNQSFDVKFPGNPTVYTWKLGKTVHETGAHKFGSSQYDDKSSKPIATLTYDVLWRIDLPNGAKQLVVFTSARTGVGPTQNFISTTKAMGIDQFYQRYMISAVKKSGPTGDPYFAYTYQYVGNIESEEDAATMRALYDQYVKSGFIVDVGDEETPPSAPRSEPRDYGHYGEDKGPRDSDDIPF
jgi:hypothetical protein